MEFEDMQVLWNSQHDEKLFAINETVLYEHIKSKGKSVNHWLKVFDWVMMGVNLFVSIFLTVDAIQDGGPSYQFVIAGIYFVYAIYALILRLKRRQEEENSHFAPSMLGELDKALWRVNYLIQQAQSIILWYTLPLIVVVTVPMLWNGKIGIALALLLVLLPASYYGARWEINKWYLPKKKELESIREKLLTPEPDMVIHGIS